MSNAEKFELSVTKKQLAFIETDATEVLFGGAAGGGKSWAQLIDAFLYAVKYPKSKQLILRRTFPELEKSLIRSALGLYPKGRYKYNSSNHTMTFQNGSLIDFGYCDVENDVFKYQSSEYDVIRFDELTHFSETMYLYLTSRLRGANNFPKQIKSSTNPGGVGHEWVKARFIDCCPANTINETPTGTRIFIPSFVTDNKFLIDKDPQYLTRLENLSETDKKALLYGDWDIFEGQYFPEFDRKIHVVEPFEIPEYWQRFCSLDYGLDMTACLWYAVNTQGDIFVYKEFEVPNLAISDAAAYILDRTRKDEKIQYIVASPDLWNRRQETGKSGVEIMYESGIKNLVRATNSRVPGWRIVREYLKPRTDEFGEQSAKLKIFKTCTEIIKCLPKLQHDPKDPEDAAGQPHEITHAPESLRYGLVSRHAISKEPKSGKWPRNSIEDRVEKNLERLTSKRKRSVIPW